MPLQKELRAHLIVLDGCGVGELPDAHEYGDSGSNTIGNLARSVGGLDLPNFETLGLGNIIPIDGVSKSVRPLFSYGKMAEKGRGKDSTIGHWELAGLISPFAFPTYPDGFPQEFIDEFEKAIGRGTLGNFPASGTEIIERLGEDHIRTGKPIVYTSADSVFQIASHLDVVPLETLYEWCETARRLLMPPNPTAGRVIARPFMGEQGNFVRTYDRKDYGVEPPGNTVLDCLKESGREVISVGKVDTLFTGRGFTRIEHYAGNDEGMKRALEVMKDDWTGLMFFNLIDFDQTWGHRNDAHGFARGLKAVDDWIPDFLAALKPTDLAIITADHGNDPTTKSTDHSREYVPLLAYQGSFLRGQNLGIRETFADVGKTIAHYFNINCEISGTSFLLP
ncbi:MAG TPA: phosphopentomutase [Firmicutes bacterium]|nr:phosphopentomutase [Bacillota bacterium]